MLIIHNRKMKETSPHDKLGEHFYECRAQWRVCLSVCLSLPRWTLDVRVEEQSEKGCFFIRVICWSAWLSARKHNSSASTDKDLIRPELCVPTAGPCGAFPWRFKDVSNNTQYLSLNKVLMLGFHINFQSGSLLSTSPLHYAARHCFIIENAAIIG